MRRYLYALGIRPSWSALLYFVILALTFALIGLDQGGCTIHFNRNP